MRECLRDVRLFAWATRERGDRTYAESGIGWWVFPTGGLGRRMEVRGAWIADGVRCEMGEEEER